VIRRSPSVTRQSFTIMPNVTLNDNRMSWEAKGMLAYLISKPDNWVIMVNHLVKESPKAKKEKVLAILSELESLGYITNNGQRINDEKGQFSHVERVVHEVAMGSEIIIIPDETVGRFTVNGSAVNGSTVNGEVPHLVSTELKQVLNEVSTEDSSFTSPEKSGDGHTPEPVKSKQAKKEKPYSAEFEEVWRLYPRKINKGKAQENFIARIRSGETVERLMQATKNYASNRQGEPEMYTLHGATFFGSSLRYQDFLDTGAGISETVAPVPNKAGNALTAIENFMKRHL